MIKCRLEGREHEKEEKKEKNEAQKEVKIWLTAPFLMGYNTGCPMFSWGVKQLTFFSSFTPPFFLIFVSRCGSIRSTYIYTKPISSSISSRILLMGSNPCFVSMSFTWAGTFSRLLFMMDITSRLAQIASGPRSYPPPPMDR